jgi:hypothetical protein
MAKSLKPRLVITENNGKWTLCTETSLRRTTIEFTPGFEYEETTPDGRELKVKKFICKNEFNSYLFLGNYSI